MNLYYYMGPVFEFDRIVVERWTATTRAASEKRARSNLAYQFKMKTGRVPGTKISIPGKLKIIEGDEQNNG